MNREQAKQLLPIIRAFADGEDVQYFGASGEWVDWNFPAFVPSLEYRIKPKPMERWLVVDCDGDARGEPRGFFDESAARGTMERLRSLGGPHAPYRLVHLHEVIE